MLKLILATRNSGKLKEMKVKLKEYPVMVACLTDYPEIPEIEETGKTFAENASIKAETVAKWTKLPALADDSGLEVDALHGAPGIYSARYAGEPKSDARNNARLLASLAEVPEGHRQARYWCVLVLLRDAEDPVPIIVQRSWEGEILQSPRGEGGFGYDPLFWLADQGASAAELSAEQKNRLSHRGRAMQALVAEMGTGRGQR